jgi:hypothetical protein
MEILSYSLEKLLSQGAKSFLLNDASVCPVPDIAALEWRGIWH